MPMRTIELPRSMVDAVYAYADRESMTLQDFFADMLKRQYGYVMTVKVATEAPLRKGRGILSSYTSPQRRIRERNAWENAVKEKYAR